MEIIANLKRKAKLLKAEIQVLALAYSDKRTPFLAKLVIGLTVGYLLSPIDLIPDFIPILGLLDDLIIVPLLILLSIRLIPASVLQDARERAIKNSKNHKNYSPTKNRYVLYQLQTIDQLEFEVELSFHQISVYLVQ